MKPTFREAVDKQLSGIEFSDEMKLNVLIQSRRRRHIHRAAFAAAACACAVFAGAFFLHSRLSAPDPVFSETPPALLTVSSENADIAVNSCEWQGYYLNIGYTVTSKSENVVQLKSSPFIAADNALIEIENGMPVSEDTERAIYLAPGESIQHTASLRADRCQPDDTVEIKLASDIYILDNSSIPEHVDTLLTAEVPSDFRKGTYISSGETAANGMFSVEINKGYFDPDETSLLFTITSSRTLLRKSGASFRIRFTNEAGDVSVEYPLNPSKVNSNAGRTGEDIFSFNTVLHFAPAEIRIICEWSEDGNIGTAEAVFAGSTY